MKKDNITNINEYRENIQPDATGIYIEPVSEEMVNMYLSEIDHSTPDLWNRIETGFDIEARDIIKENKMKSAKKKKIIGIAAAVLLVTIIAVPVIVLNNVGMSEKEATTSATWEESEDETVTESVAMEESEAIKESEMMEQPAVEESVTMENSSVQTDDFNDEASDIPVEDVENNTIIVNGDASSAVQTDDRTLSVHGEFVTISEEECIFEITLVSGSEYGDLAIDEGTWIIITNKETVLNMEVEYSEWDAVFDSVHVNGDGEYEGRLIEFTP